MAGFRSRIAALLTLLRLACLLLGIGVISGPSQAAGSDAVVTLHTAQATLAPDGATPQAVDLQLPFRWDHRYPGRAGHARYQLLLPALTKGDDTPRALLISSLGNQATVSVGGTTVARLGNLGDANHDASKTAQLIRIPAGLLRRDAPTSVVIDTTTQRQRGGGLDLVHYGPETALEARYDSLRRWRNTAAVVYSVSLLLMGGLAAGLWWRQRDVLYGCFSLAAFSGVVRNLDRAWVDVPVPWPAWGAIVAIGYAWHIALIARFVLLVLDRNPPWLVRTIHVAMGLGAMLAAASFMFAQPVLWTTGLVLLEVTALACLPIVLQEAFGQRRRIAWVLVGAGMFAVAAGANDLLRVRLGLFGGSDQTLTPHAIFVFVVILAGLVVDRYSRSVADHRALNASLRHRLDEQEGQLRTAFDELRRREQEQAVLLERQRIMREIHDGVGSQLVGLLNMVGQPDAKASVLEEHVKLALDEMRMAVDSLQPNHGDLTTVLATLRYRLQPRLEAAGITLAWEVAAMPPIASFNAQVALQLQRILLEAFTNILKHAGATRIAMAALCIEAPEPHVRIVLTDDGRGLGSLQPPRPGEGRGMANMKARAHAIGAMLSIAAGPEGGTCVTLEWPYAQGTATPAAQ
ncbi:MAG: ATP-binding protein [Pseudomonadota bacterium]